MELIKEIKELENKLAEKRKEYNKILSEEITKSMIEGKYYKIWNFSEGMSIYFKYTKNNFQILDGKGTVGYNESNYIKINKCFFQTIHRFYYECGVKSGITFDVKLLLKDNILQKEIEEIDEQTFIDIKEEIKKSIEGV